MTQIEAFEFTQSSKYREEKMKWLRESKCQYFLFGDQSPNNSFHNMISSIELAAREGWKCISITAFHDTKARTSFMFALMAKI